MFVYYQSERGHERWEIVMSIKLNDLSVKHENNLQDIVVDLIYSLLTATVCLKSCAVTKYPPGAHCLPFS